MRHNARLRTRPAVVTLHATCIDNALKTVIPALVLAKALHRSMNTRCPFRSETREPLVICDAIACRNMSARSAAVRAPLRIGTRHRLVVRLQHVHAKSSGIAS